MLCVQGSVTEVVKQSYPDHVSNPGRGERSFGPHGCIVLSSLIKALMSLTFGIVASRWAEGRRTLSTLTELPL